MLSLSKMLTKVILITLLLNAFSVTYAATQHKVLLIGIDGVQFEQLQKSDIVNLAHLQFIKAFAGGFKNTSSQQATLSGPGWVSILTGVWANKHYIFKNDDTHSNATSLFKLIKQAKPKAYIASISHWANINTHYFYQDMAYVNTQLQEISDSIAIKETLKILEKEDPDFIFLCLDDVDHIGHKEGFSINYRKTISAIDQQLGNIFTMIDQRELNLDEKWLILVTTDHGRAGAGFNHGGQSTAERTIFIASNQSLKNNIMVKKASLVSIAPTILSFLGVSYLASRFDGHSLLSNKNTQ